LRGSDGDKGMPADGSALIYSNLRPFS
jgi:hypothetical protein